MHLEGYIQDLDLILLVLIPVLWDYWKVTKIQYRNYVTV